MMPANFARPFETGQPAAKETNTFGISLLFEGQVGSDIKYDEFA